MFTVQTVGSFTYLALTVLTPFVKSSFQASTSEIGFLVTALYFGYFVSLLPGGILTDHAGERFTLGLGMGVVGVVAVSLSIATNLLMLIAGAFLLGAAYGMTPSGTNKAIYDWFPPSRRTIGISIKQAGVMVGGGAGAALLPWFATTAGWRGATLLVGVVALGSLVPLYIYRPAESVDGSRIPSRETFGRRFRRMARLARQPDMVVLLVSGALFGISQFTLMAYAVLYLTESLLLAPTIAGVVYTGIQLAGLASRTCLGFLTDSLFDQRKHLVLAGLGGAGSLCYLLLATLTPATPIVVVGAVTVSIGGLALGYNGIYLTMASDIADDGETGAATAVGVGAVVGGAVLFPPLFGYVVDATGDYSLPIASLAFIMLGAGVAAAWVGHVNQSVTGAS